MDIPGIVELIENHGFSIVIIILIFFASYKFFDKFFDWFLVLLRQAFEKSWVDPNKAREKVSIETRKQFFASMRRLEFVDDLLEQLRDTTGADRVAVFQYHNGGTTVAGIPYLRCSMTNESLKRGNQPNIPLLQGLPVGIFGRWNRMVSIHKKVYLSSVDLLQETDPTTWEILSDQRIKSIYVAGLYDRYQLPIGFLTVEGCLSNLALSPEKISEIDDITNKVSGVLSVLNVDESSRSHDGYKDTGEEKNEN